MSIISANDVSGHPSSDPQTLADRAAALIEDYCGWHVAPIRDDEVTVEADGSGLVFLPTLHIESILSVEVDGEPRPVERRDWSQAGWVRVNAGCGVPVKVQMRHGYAVTESLKAAALALSASIQQSPDGRAVASQRLADRQVGYFSPAQLSGASAAGDVLSTLDRYVLPSRP